MSPSPDSELGRRVRSELLRRLADSDLPYQVAIPTAVFTAASMHLREHWKDAAGPAASFLSVEFALRLGVSVATMVPVMVWLLRRRARRDLTREESVGQDRPA